MSARRYGVGGGDVLVELRAGVPVRAERIGMEWFIQLMQEPRRLFRRHLVTNSQTIWLVPCALMKRD
jgi:N-acetylglucosaminyldiphosphoundecaprenol N-acetyl-beta-D-mannosaminyltransferase